MRSRTAWTHGFGRFVRMASLSLPASPGPSSYLTRREVSKSMLIARSFVSRVDALIRTIYFRSQNGQGLAEYALILALIAIMAIIALLFLGSQISTKLSTIGDAV
jgi:pilus assembly protein Flp/PilA